MNTKWYPLALLVVAVVLAGVTGFLFIEKRVTWLESRMTAQEDDSWDSQQFLVGRITELESRLANAEAALAQLQDVSFPSAQESMGTTYLSQYTSQVPGLDATNWVVWPSDIDEMWYSLAHCTLRNEEIAVLLYQGYPLDRIFGILCR